MGVSVGKEARREVDPDFKVLRGGGASAILRQVPWSWGSQASRVPLGDAARRPRAALRARGGRAPTRRRGAGAPRTRSLTEEHRCFLITCAEGTGAPADVRGRRASPAAQPAPPPGPPPALQPEASPSRPPFSACFFCEIRPGTFKESAKLLKRGKGGNIIRLVLIRESVGPPSVGGSASAFILVGMRPPRPPPERDPGRPRPLPGLSL